MKSFRLWFVGVLICGLGLTYAQFDAGFVPQIFAPDLLWAKWGNDLRNSHYNPNAQGPTNPRVLWFRPGGLIDEPLVDNAAVLWAPVHPYSTGLRYTQYQLYDALGGTFLGSIGPFWGQATTPIIFQTAVYVRSDNGDFVDVIGNWPVLVFTGGQYDVTVFSPDPLGVADLYWVGNVGLPAYHSGLTAYTDGTSGYFLLGDNAGWIRPVMVFWVVAGNESFPHLYIDAPIIGPDTTPPAGAVYGLTGSSLYSDLMISVHHSTNQIGAQIFAIDMTALGAPGVLWGASLADLSRANPQDTTPIDSDTCDRPAVMSTDNQTIFLCATNSGRVYAVDALNGGAKLWVAELGQPIMAGPSLGPDPQNGNEETLYVVTRSGTNRSTLVAIRAADGTVKWQRALGTVSRCTPTIDGNGRLFIGDDRGTLYAFNPDGTILWRRNLGAPIRVAPVLASVPTDAGAIDVLYVAASNRMLYAFVETTPIRIPPGGTTGGSSQ
jgi:outer membrane protein assembly factor BamB